ncbi:DUF1365 domain-containing protein [Desulfosarcina sp.]|uniref:DUF1365 domain-containing protein n=1 Tax=Desulfosarcina sp. TaxID=2027861 RepID=UPI00356B3EC9
MNSAIYRGTIRHRRFTPVGNAFQYRIFFMLLDLAEMSQVSTLHPLWSADRVNLAYFRRRDHFGDPMISLDRALRNHVEAKAGQRPTGPIRMLTHLRYFGHCFNPVTFYFLYDSGDCCLETIVAEIANTPWGERHLYVLDAASNVHPDRRWRRFRFSKEFHISPFMPMNIDYDWRFSVPSDRLNVHLMNFQDGEPVFDATLNLYRRPMNRQNLTRMLILYPAMTLKVVAMIYWQALKLKLKQTPFYDHPGEKMRVTKKMEASP